MANDFFMYARGLGDIVSHCLPLLRRKGRRTSWRARLAEAIYNECMAAGDRERMRREMGIILAVPPITRLDESDL